MARPRKNPPKFNAELLAQFPPLPEAGALDTVEDAIREWSRLHRGRDREQLDPFKFRDLVYSLQVGTPLLKAREELRELARLRTEIERIQSSGIPALDTATADDYAALSPMVKQEDNTSIE